MYKSILLYKGKLHNKCQSSQRKSKAENFAVDSTSLLPPLLLLLLLLPPPPPPTPPPEAPAVVVVSLFFFTCASACACAAAVAVEERDEAATRRESVFKSGVQWGSCDLDTAGMATDDVLLLLPCCFWDKEQGCREWVAVRVWWWSHCTLAVTTAGSWMLFAANGFGSFLPEVNLHNCNCPSYFFNYDAHTNSQYRQLW